MSCTFWPERLLGLNLTFACKYHDWHYARQKVSRRIADRNLRRRIVKEARDINGNGEYRAILIAWVMWLGVRLFGWYAWIKNKKEEPFII